MAFRHSDHARLDRFGNPYVLKRAKQIKTKEGELLDYNFRAYFEISGKVYQIDISENKKDYQDGLDSLWVKITKRQKLKPQTF